jgi:hypothetical protein
MSPRRALAALVVIIALAIIAYSLISRMAIAWDLTAEQSATLSDETKRVLRDIEERIEITAFFPREAAGRVEAATLLSRYREANRRITYRILDPEIAPGEAQRLGVNEVGAAAARQVGDRDEVEIAQYTIEIDITSAIARLLRDVQGTVCFSTGHGERSSKQTTSDGYSEAVSLLEGNGYRTRAIDLVTDASKLDTCDAIVVAAPTNRISKKVRERVIDHVTAGGKILLFADPKVDANLTPLAKPWGIRFVDGIVLEGDDASHLPQDVTSPIVSRYAGASAVVRGLGPTFFPGALGVVGKPSKDPGLTVAEIAFTSELGYLDRADVESFDEDVDVAGPVALAASADDSEVQAPGTRRARIKRTRVLAFGDADFASNAFIHDGANAKLFIQGIDWLTQPEDLVTAVPQFPKLRELELTQARNRYMLFLMAGVVPGLFVIAGGFVWVIRRSR